eukprot:25806-Hanusia_phi.AAC.2
MMGFPMMMCFGLAERMASKETTVMNELSASEAQEVLKASFAYSAIIAGTVPRYANDLPLIC